MLIATNAMFCSCDGSDGGCSSYGNAGSLQSVYKPSLSESKPSTRSEVAGTRRKRIAMVDEGRVSASARTTAPLQAANLLGAPGGGLEKAWIPPPVVSRCPSLVEDQRAVALRVLVPCAKDDDPVSSVDEGPTPRPVAARSAMRFDEGSSTHQTEGDAPNKWRSTVARPPAARTSGSSRHVLRGKLTGVATQARGAFRVPL
jgi:hypothetical protein